MKNIRNILLPAILLLSNEVNASSQTVSVNNLSCSSSYSMAVKSLSSYSFTLGEESNIAGTIKLTSNLPSEYVTFSVQAYISGYATTFYTAKNINVCGGGFKALSSTTCPNKGLYYFGTGVNLPTSPITVSNINLGITANDSDGTQVMSCTFGVSIESSSYNMSASMIVCGAGAVLLVGALLIKRRSRKIAVIDTSVLNDFAQMDDDAVSGNIECRASSTLNANNSVLV